MFDLIFETFNKKGCSNSSNNQQQQQQEQPFIGILDIFGFEILDQNNFEQLCINYANESLQLLFNDHMFVYEKEYYKTEEINVGDLNFTDNKNLLNLFTDKKNGIFTLIDEQLLLGGRGSDLAVLSGLTKSHGRSGKDKPGHLNYALPKLGNESFIIKHYAGDVEYQVHELLAKNSDSVHQDLMAMTSDDAFVSTLMTSYQNKRNGTKDNKGRKGSEEEKKEATSLKRTESTQLLGSTTISQRVILQMETLSSLIRSCTPHFVRCIKPNNAAQPAPNFDAMLVTKQLRFLGLVETCRIRRQGYPNRVAFAKLILKYGPLVPTKFQHHTRNSTQLPSDWAKSQDDLGRKYYSNNATQQSSWTPPEGSIGGSAESKTNQTVVWTEYSRDEDGAKYYYNKETQETVWIKPTNVVIAKEDTVQAQCIRLLTKYIGTSDSLDWQMGKTKVFLKDQKIEILDDVLAKYYENEENALKEISASKIQNCMRIKLAKMKVKALKAKQKAEEERLRRVAAEIEKQRLIDERAAADEAEKNRLNCAIKIQALMRGRKAKKLGVLAKKLAMRKKASTKLQSLVRMRSKQTMFQKQQSIAVKIQSLKRMKSRRASMANKKKALVKIQSTARMRTNRMKLTSQIKCCKLVQRNYRGYRIRQKVQIIQNARQEWKQFLSPNEAVLFASLVRKEAGGGVAKLLGFKKRRQLLMTSRPRFLYVDPNDGTLKGDVDFTGDDGVRVDLAIDIEKEEQKSDPTYKASKKDISQDFRVHTSDRVYLFTDLLGFANQWKKCALDYAETNKKGSTTMNAKTNAKTNATQDTIRKVMPMFVGVGDMVKRGFDIQHSVLIQGYLTKQSIKGRFGKKWTKRWFVLHGHTLYYFKSDQDAAPKGKINIPAEASIAPSADKPHCWRLTTPEMPTGMLIKAENAKEKRKWIEAMRAAIVSQSSAEWTAQRDGPTEETLRASGLNLMDMC